MRGGRIQKVRPHLAWDGPARLTGAPPALGASSARASERAWEGRWAPAPRSSPALTCVLLRTSQTGPERHRPAREEREAPALAPRPSGGWSVGPASTASPAPRPPTSPPKDSFSPCQVADLYSLCKFFEHVEDPDLPESPGPPTWKEAGPVPGPGHLCPGSCSVGGRHPVPVARDPPGQAGQVPETLGRCSGRPGWSLAL